MVGIQWMADKFGYLVSNFSSIWNIFSNSAIKDVTIFDLLFGGALVLYITWAGAKWVVGLD